MYCRNVFDGKKHYYSKKHIDNAKYAIDSLAAAKEKLLDEYVEEALVPHNCIFCDIEQIPEVICTACPKDRPKCKSLLHHMCEDTHYKSAKSFIRRNRMDTKLLDDVVCVKSDLTHYHQNHEFYKQEYLNERLESHDSEKAQKGQDGIANSENGDELLLTSPTGILQHPRGYIIDKTSGVRVRVWGGGVIDKDLQYRENELWSSDELEEKYLSIYANTLEYEEMPPWLCSDGESASESDSGDEIIDDDYMPNFGRVWSTGTRTEGSKAFLDSIGSRKRKR